MVKKKWQPIAISLIFFLGIVVLLYPLVSAIISKATSTAAVKDYQAAVQKMDTSAQDAMFAAAQDYNAKFFQSVTQDTLGKEYGSQSTEYNNLLNVDGIMGYLDIPCVDIYLPIYHGVSEDVLQKGIGHLPQTALPVGGEGTHAVLSSHCGLPNARLFTDLDQITEGDKFFVHILRETLAYKVNKIQVVLPEEAQGLGGFSGEDYVTLLTCTPYGINSHRLLVRGTRIPYIEENTEVHSPIAEDNNVPFNWLWYLWILVPIVFLGWLWLWLWKPKKKYNK
ncbi:MAG: class C sortase [Clostridiales bacterium]